MRLLYFVCSLAVLYCEGLGGEAVRGLGGGWHGSFTCVVSGNDSGPAHHLKRDAHAVSWPGCMALGRMIFPAVSSPHSFGDQDEDAQWSSLQT